MIQFSQLAELFNSKLNLLLGRGLTRIVAAYVRKQLAARQSISWELL